MSDIKVLLKDLCALRGVSGNETSVAEYIKNAASRLSDDITTDALGNVFVKVKGAKASDKVIAFAAHMDEVGLIATRVTDDGYVKFGLMGGIDKRVLPGKRVWFGADSANTVGGVIGMTPIHLIDREERTKAIPLKDMYIDIGACDKAEALTLISIGDTAAFDADFLEFGDGFIRSKAIDDRAGCAVLLKLMENAPRDATFVFTTQEELGLRGATVAANRTQPDIAVIIEGTTAADFPGVSDNKKVCRVGAGAVCPFMDGGSIADRGLWNMSRALAEKYNIAWQTKEWISGGTDGAAFQKAACGARVMGISVPVRNLHSPSCVAKWSDIENVLALAERIYAELE